MKKYIVTAIDIGETCDGHASLLGVFSTLKEAECYIKEDMKDTIRMSGIDNLIVDENDFEVFTDKSMTEGCIWDIHEVEV